MEYFPGPIKAIAINPDINKSAFSISKKPWSHL